MSLVSWGTEFHRELCFSSSDLDFEISELRGTFSLTWGFILLCPLKFVSSFKWIKSPQCFQFATAQAPPVLPATTCSSLPHIYLVPLLGTAEPRAVSQMRDTLVPRLAVNMTVLFSTPIWEQTRISGPSLAMRCLFLHLSLKWLGLIWSCISVHDRS